MKKYYFFMSLFFLTMYPRLTAPKESKASSITPLIKINESDCTVPAINPKKYFPFCQKSDQFKLSCIRDGFSKFEIISQKLPIDRDNIYRWSLSAMSLQDILGDTLESIKPFLSIYVKEAFGDHDKVIPKILYFKQNIVVGSIPASIIGVEFCFENQQKTIPGLSRIALFFVQNITKKEDVKTANKTGINHLTLYNAEKNVLILSNTLDTENIIDTIFKKLIEKHKEKIPSFLSKIIENKVTSIGKNQIGLIIEKTDNEQRAVNDYKDTYGLHYIPLTDHNYLFYKKRVDLYNTDAQYFIGSLKNQSIPINSNYHLYSTIMGYNEKDIEFKYQFEEYLRSINKINSDNTIAWPYDISDHKEAFNKWVKKTWESKSFINLFFTPHINRKYQDDKKETSVILKKMKDEYNTEHKKEVLNLVKKIKNVSEASNQKKIQKSFNTMRKMAEKLDTEGAKKLLGKIIKNIMEKRSHLDYRKHGINELPATLKKPYSDYTKIKEVKSYQPQDKKENKSAQENQSELKKVNTSNNQLPKEQTKPIVMTKEKKDPETESWGSYLKNSANKAKQFIGKATSPATKYFVYTEEGEEEDSPSTNRNKEIIPSTSTTEKENTSDNQLIKSQTKPIIESEKEETNKKITDTEFLVNTSTEEVNETTERSIESEKKQSKKEALNISDNQSTIDQTKPIIKTEKGSSGNSANKATRTTTNREIIPSKSVLNTSTQEVNETNERSIESEKKQSKKEELNISENQSTTKQTKRIIETKKNPVKIKVVEKEQEPEARSWGWGWGKNLLDKVTSRLADNYFVDTEPEKETHGSTNTTSTGPNKDIVSSEPVVKPDRVDDPSNDYNDIDIGKSWW